MISLHRGLKWTGRIAHQGQLPPSKVNHTQQPWHHIFQGLYHQLQVRAKVNTISIMAKGPVLTMSLLQKMVMFHRQVPNEYDPYHYTTPHIQALLGHRTITVPAATAFVILRLVDHSLVWPHCYISGVTGSGSWPRLWLPSHLWFLNTSDGYQEVVLRVLRCIYHG